MPLVPCAVYIEGTPPHEIVGLGLPKLINLLLASSDHRQRRKYPGSPGLYVGATLE